MVTLLGVPETEGRTVESSPFGVVVINGADVDGE